MLSAYCHTHWITGDGDLLTVQLRATTLSLSDESDHQHLYIYKIRNNVLIYSFKTTVDRTENSKLRVVHPYR